MDSGSPQTNETRRTIRAFSVASFLNDMGADMIFSVWPLFLTNTFGVGMEVIGLIDGIGDAIVSLSQAVSGYLSDRFRKRKIFVWMGYCFGGIARIGYALAPTWQTIVPFRILDRSGKMRGAPRDAMISEASTRQNRGHNFGILRTMDNAGAVAGIVIAMFLIERIGYRDIFMIATIPSIAAVAVILLFVRETTPSTRIFKGIRLHDLSRDLRLYLILSAVFSVSSFSYSFLLIFAKKSGIATPAIPAMYLLFTFVAMFFSLPFGRLSDRIGRKPVLLIAFFCWGSVAALFMIRQTFAALIAGFILYGLHKAALEPVQKTIVAELAPKDYVASTLGGYQMIMGLCSLPASLTAGVLWEYFGPVATFGCSLALTCIAAILALFLGNNDHRIEKITTITAEKNHFY